MTLNTYCYGFDIIHIQYQLFAMHRVIIYTPQYVVKIIIDATTFVLVAHK